MHWYADRANWETCGVRGGSFDPIHAERVQRYMAFTKRRLCGIVPVTEPKEYPVSRCRLMRHCLNMRRKLDARIVPRFHPHTLDNAVPIATHETNAKTAAKKRIAERESMANSLPVRQAQGRMALGHPCRIAAAVRPYLRIPSQ